MRDLLKWEMKNTLKSKAFWGLGAAFVIGTFLLLLIPITEGGNTGFDMYLSTLNDFNSLLLFFIGAFAGIHITGAFDERRIQAAVMAGNSRLSILFAKILSYSFSVAAFCTISVLVSSITAFAVGGAGEMDGSFLRAVIIRGFVFILVETAFSNICVLISLLVKNLGAAIAVNLISLITIYSVAEIFIGRDHVLDVLRFTPLGQLFLLFFDVSNFNLITASAVSVAAIALTLGLCYLKFRKEELK
ncbi:ABC transporter permease [Butyrivibrio sp. AE2032]|uniref:ABC transporter permease n=1 Tax=Butyrivibrio sp. AE2032 TaxID=1458463 RepID=UPI0005576B80|nr:ABC transporter permease [Butyrivibrio sp. AE2032]